MNILFVNCCMRSAEVSRTSKLCAAFLEAYQAIHKNACITERNLNDTDLQWYTAELVEKRDQLSKKEQWEHSIFDLAHEFAQADKIIIGAPYWDLSFPALLKVYFENIFACGITFAYEAGRPVGLCNGKKLLYITTSGGFIGDKDYGTDYLQGLCDMFGIPEMTAIKGEGLDIQELDREAFLDKALKEAKALAATW